MSNQVKFLEPIEVLKKIRTGSAYVVDIREPHEHAQSHIKNVPLMSLSKFNPKEIKPAENQLLILHCRSGHRCGIVSDQLIASGYKGLIYRMSGGLLAWEKAGLPLETNITN
jgi:rhodanese-related sulfurtransferase